MLIFGEQEQSVEIFAENAAGAKIGDRVLLSSSGANVLLLSLFVFFIPVLASVAAYFTSLHLFVSEYVHYICLGVVFAVFFVLGCCFGNRYAKLHLKTEIVKIIEESGE
jgi:positive regulator of sigma E activity